ncbi:MAG: peptidoglycan DD-metalloendopeptidase family protein [Gemmatimonadota bacterium]
MLTRITVFAFVALTWLTACAGPRAGGPPRRRAPDQVFGTPTQVPDTTWGTHVLVVARSPEPDVRLWVGTYGRGIFVFRPDSAKWDRLTSGDSTAISWNFVNSFAFPDDSSIWYGTVGNGWGRSKDGGRTWRNWKFSELGPEWQYVIPDGLRNRGDTIYIATADGLRITSNDGSTYRCVQASSRIAGGSTARSVPCAEHLYTLPSEYVLSFDVAHNGDIWVGHLFGVAVSKDRGATWQNFTAAEGAPTTRVRSVLASDTLGMVWLATEREVYRRARPDSAFRRFDLKLPGWPEGLPGGIRAVYPAPGTDHPVIVTSFGMASADSEGTYRLFYLPAGDLWRPSADIWDMTWWGPPLWPVAGSQRGLNLILAGNQLPGVSFADAGAPITARDPVHEFFERPISDTDGNPHIDATYRYGSTMGGNFQQHQGVEFNNPAGTPVRAIGDGRVAFAGLAEAGANTVAILHDRRADDQHIYSVYYHNSSLEVRIGQRVAAGDVIARVGNTGRATNDHLHLEVHLAPSTDSAAIVNPQERYPKFTTNPQLWIRPLPGTGIVAGRVRDAEGKPVPGARVHGLVLPFPEETPYSFAETYRERAHSLRGYDEDFAVGDVPAGTYLLGVDIGETRVWRRVRVEAGRVTIVEFEP